ncbi:unnamed protein product [Symbiodinium necroappetens]|uniref:PDZ domain-containing protein n=1 Tax=Symbiodinium necroappetens TaxID=1628268 RepID=A0A812YPC7_9DINO|nr:unnamed protein product [Symbiodinium necroappetens]
MASRAPSSLRRPVTLVALAALLFGPVRWPALGFCNDKLVISRGSSGSSLRAQPPDVKPEPDFGAEFAKSLQEGLGLNEAYDKEVTAAQRVTPIDRLFGWDKGIIASRDDLDPFMDSRDEMNYVSVSLDKPLGLEFLENGADEGGGVLIGKVAPASNADQTGVLRAGYHLVFVNGTPVHGLSFDAAIRPIVESEGAVQLTFFMGEAEYFYGEWKPGEEWLGEFQAKLQRAESTGSSLSPEFRNLGLENPKL